ncbi:MerR family transcriptional regulator [Lactobacillus sp. UCMA15818]|nr:MerR family transcriptional regulator [Lactobacillus sp. UCMA15818]
MVEELFTIGQTAEMFGLSVQALRYYSKIGLLTPRYTNPNSGYRYYSYEQFNIIDRIKHLQHLGLSLNEIHDIYASPNQISDLKKYLVIQKKKVTEEIDRLSQLSFDISEYEKYFSFDDNNDLSYIPYKVHRPTRHILQVSCIGKTREQRHIDLFRLRHSQEYKNLDVLRQFVLVLDWQDFKKHIITPLKMGLLVVGNIPSNCPDIMKLPARNSICFQGKILTDDWNGQFAIKIAQAHSCSGVVIASEYENSLSTFDNCIYEVEIQI